METVHEPTPKEQAQLTLSERLADYRARIREMYKSIEALEDLEFAENGRPAMLANVGKLFKYRNNYSCPAGDNDYWWMYSKIVGVRERSYRFLGFSTDKYGEVKIETFTSSLLDGFQPIDATEFLAAVGPLLASVADEAHHDTQPITADWLHSVGFLPDDTGKFLAVKIWERGLTEDNGEEPAMHFGWNADDGSCWLETYGTGGDTLCLLELEPKKTRGEIRRFCAALGIKLSANLCPTCCGTGQVINSYEHHDPEMVGCAHCMGSGKVVRS